MKAMRAFSSERKELRIELVSVREEKKWGDWELEKVKQVYKNGRVVPKVVLRTWRPRAAYYDDSDDSDDWF